MRRPLLAAEDLHRRFGGVRALAGASLEVGEAEIHALVGENGSGKTTLLRILSGQIRPDAGRIVLDGEPVELANPTAALRRGIVTVTQETTLAPDLSVAENIFLGRRMARRGPLIDWRATERRARGVLGRLGLEIAPRAIVGRLRPDQQQMVEIARAISMDARLLILDEPTSSLTDDEVQALFAIVRRLRENGVATIFVSHRLGEVFELCERYTVLRDGVRVGSGAVADVDRRALIGLMVGREHEEVQVEGAADESGTPALRIRNLSVPGAVYDVSFDVMPGEVVGLAGLVGAGRSELLESLFGLHAGMTGSVQLAGEQLRIRGPRHAIRAGLGFVPAERRRRGLVLQMSVRENLMMMQTAHRTRLASPTLRREGPVVAQAVRELRIVTPSGAAPVSTLSGGNQQKVVLAKCLLTRPKVLMLDEPTRGVDVGAKTEIYRLLAEAAAGGIAILVSSSETPELLMICDRILVFFRGRVTATLAREDANEAAIAHHSAGHQ